MPLATDCISAMVSGGMGYFHLIYSPDCPLTFCQTLFDVSQATLLQEHTQALSARQAIAQSRNSRGLLDTILRRNPPAFKPTYNYHPDGSACRIFGTVTVKKVTGKRFCRAGIMLIFTSTLTSEFARHNPWAWLHQSSACRPQPLVSFLYAVGRVADQFCSDEPVARHHRIFVWPLLSRHRPTARQFL